MGSVSRPLDVAIMCSHPLLKRQLISESIQAMEVVIAGGLFSSKSRALPSTRNSNGIWDVRMVEISMHSSEVAILYSTHPLATPSLRYLLLQQVKEMIGTSDSFLRRLVKDGTTLLEDKETLATLK